ncbi:Molybdopterin synthase catalytic subunit [Bagarius yarrelli]|uniref:Molybdopterin synthase catalytic subunit n=1 Tax=Bagarius yarrelli TaxID=175774 RepID=A0A556VA44_BAGYA|nr:Molybdopterin synthase catalytic subunit [Bagarius yarrelli]
MSRLFLLRTTRDHFEGKKVVQLEYEAYVPMAESELRKICADVRRRWPAVRHICIHHRLGVVPVREASVIIGISSPHRSDSLEAVKFGIDALKSSVPIWKKELYESEESCWKENSECVWTGRLDQRKNS